MTDLLAGLTDDQRRAAETLDGPVLIKAGPGSGKTRTITHRIAYGVASGRYEASRTLAVTFTARAAGELHSRLARLGAVDVAVRTFHSAALRQLRHFWPDAIGGTPPRIEAHRTPLVSAAAERAGAAHDRESTSMLMTELDWIKARGLTADSYAQGAAVERDIGSWTPGEVAKVLAAYEDVKSERGVMDFDDVLLVTIGLLSTRSDIRESVRRVFRWITVDEYQDVSPLQQRLLDLWVGDRHQICVVGDAAQTIYQFAGADPTILATFPKRYPSAAVVELDTTFRCAPEIAGVANRLGHDIPGSLHLRAQSTHPGQATVLHFPSEAAEAAGVADEIAGLIRGGHPVAEIAVLYRLHQQGRALQDALRRRDVPFSTRGADKFFDRPEVIEATTRFRGELRQRPDRSAAATMGEALSAMGHERQPPEGPTARDRWESLAALAVLFTDDVSGPDGLAELERRSADNEPPPPAGVSLLTLHSAKGLEWDTVFVIGATDSALPYVRARSPEAQAEERRLMYVGVTRPRRRLVVTWPGSSRPSPFIAEAFAGTGPQKRDGAASLGTPSGPGGAVDLAGSGLPPARCRHCSRALVTGEERVVGRCHTCPSTADPRLLEDLTVWRDAQAQSRGVPHHVVLTDATLQAIAEQRPGTQAELREIPGMHGDRLERHGNEVLALVNRLPADPRP